MQLVSFLDFRLEFFFLAEYFLIKMRRGGGQNKPLFFKKCEVTMCMLHAVCFQTETKRKMML